MANSAALNRSAHRYSDKRLPCRGCLTDCQNYSVCEGKPWRQLGPAYVVESSNASSAGNALLVVAHGSRVQRSNQEVAELVNELTASMQENFAITQCAFLELASPSIAEGIERCYQQGATRITLLPYFLSAGKHVRNDIPEEAQAACNTYQLPLTILPHIGLSQLMIPLLQKAASSAY